MSCNVKRQVPGLVSGPRPISKTPHWYQKCSHLYRMGFMTKVISYVVNQLIAKVIDEFAN